jgi:hypothetical protein
VSFHVVGKQYGLARTLPALSNLFYRPEQASDLSEGIGESLNDSIVSHLFQNTRTIGEVLPRVFAESARVP